MRFGEVFDYRTVELAKKFLERKGAFSDSLRDISEQPEDCAVFILRATEEGVTYPFYGEHKGIFQFFRPILEDDELMTQRQLSEWLAKGHGEFTLENVSQVGINFCYESTEEDEPVEDNVLIRRWGDTEWSKPTRAIYEEDCK